MQSISLGAMVPDSPDQNSLARERFAEFIQRDDVQWLWHFSFALLIGTILLCAGWWWIASKIVVRGERATLGNAFRVWLGTLLLPLGFCVGLIFFGPAIIESLRGTGFATAWAVFGVILLLLLLLWLHIPMRVYEIGFLSALGLVLLTIALAVAGIFAADQIFHADSHREALRNSLGRTEPERRAFATRMSGKDAPDEIDRLLDDVMIPIGKPKPLPAREATAKLIQQKLEARRSALTSGDARALAEFQPRLDRYMQLLDDLKAARTAQRQEAAEH